MVKVKDGSLLQTNIFQLLFSNKDAILSHKTCFKPHNTKLRTVHLAKNLCVTVRPAVHCGSIMSEVQV